MTEQSFTNVCNVRDRLAAGIYSFPDPDWVEKYKAANKGTIAPTAEFTWAFYEVREFYGLEDSKEGSIAMGAHMGEVGELHATIVRARELAGQGK